MQRIYFNNSYLKRTFVMLQLPMIAQLVISTLFSLDLKALVGQPVSVVFATAIIHASVFCGLFSVVAALKSNRENYLSEIAGPIALVGFALYCLGVFLLPSVVSQVGVNIFVFSVLALMSGSISWRCLNERQWWLDRRVQKPV